MTPTSRSTIRTATSSGRTNRERPPTTMRVPLRPTGRVRTLPASRAERFQVRQARAADAYLQKYDPNGNLIWTHQFGTAGSDEPRGVAANAAGVYVTGLTDGTLPGQVNAGSPDAFIWKFDPSGSDAWAREFGTSAADTANGIAVAGSHVYVTGYTQDTFPGQVGGGDDAFLRNYDADGNLTWMDQFGTPTSDGGEGVAANGSRVYVAGYTFGTFPGETNFGGGTDAFVGLAAETPDAPENLHIGPGNGSIAPTRT